MKCYRYFFPLILSLIFLSCYGPQGPDGRDGTAFLNVTYTYGALAQYVDNNSRVGTTNSFTLGIYYEVRPGSYSFQYESRYYYNPPYYYYTVWSGTYLIWINKGEKGGDGKFFWQRGDAGKDGPDSYLKLICNYDGHYESRINKDIGSTPLIIDSTTSQIFKDGNYSMKVEYHLVKLGIDSVKECHSFNKTDSQYFQGHERP